MTIWAIADIKILITVTFKAEVTSGPNAGSPMTNTPLWRLVQSARAVEKIVESFSEGYYEYSVKMNNFMRFCLIFMQTEDV